MAAEFETGFFVRQPAWHKQGVVLTDEPDTDAALIAAGLDWRVEKYPLYFQAKGHRRQFQAEEFALVRDKDLSQLGCCKANYEVWQNNQAFEWCRPLVDSGLWSWETAGALSGGRVCWGLLKQGDMEVVPGDVMEQYLLVCWAHTGRMSNIVQPTTVRVVCKNTLDASLGQGGGVRVWHSSTMVPKMEQIRTMYDKSTETFEKQQEALSALVNIEMPKKEREVYVNALLPVPKEASAAASHNNTIAKYFVVEGNASGADQFGVVDTAYGAFNAFSEANEHFLGGNRVSDRGMNILFGRARERNKKAFKLALNWKLIQAKKPADRLETAMALAVAS